MSALDQLTEELANEITERILEKIHRETAIAAKKNFVFCLSEEEAASELKIDVQTLARKRKDGEIDFSRVGRRIVYMPHHLLDYLVRNEEKNGKQAVTLDDVLQFPKLKKVS